jgi:hypothetical protein
MRTSSLIFSLLVICSLNVVSQHDRTRKTVSPGALPDKADVTNSRAYRSFVFLNRGADVSLQATSAGSNATSSEDSEGQIQFNVQMPNDVLLPNLSVTIEGDHYKKQLELNADDVDVKQNLVTLPAGIYRLSSRKGNYYEFRRAPFRVQPGVVTKINVFPLIRVRTQMLMANGSDQYDFAPQPKYDSFAVRRSSDPALILLIRYDQKYRTDQSIRYSSNVLESRGDPRPAWRGVMASYDSLSIYADRIRFDSAHDVIYASGHVVLEDGRQRRHAQKLVVKFKNGSSQIANVH